MKQSNLDNCNAHAIAEKTIPSGEELKKTRPRKGKTETPSMVDISVRAEENCTSIFHDAVRLCGHLQKTAAATASAHGIKPTEMSLVDTLGKFGPLTMGRLADMSFISAPNSTRAVKNLINDGLVERKRARHSDREVVVRLTKKGRSIFQESYPQVVHDVDEYLASRLTEPDRTKLAELLAKAIQEQNN
jgi:DNA-binding MarR family transcriptional regulator